MKYLFVIPVLLFFMGCQSGPENRENHPYTALVNPLMGTREGNVFPGASVPYGMVKLGPDGLPPQSTSGYQPGKPIAGFSHTHTSGTGGGPRYGNILIIPQTGAPDLSDYASVKIVDERAFPGFYGVTLARRPGDVHAQLTATQNAGFHKYSFFKWGKQDSTEASLFIDVAHTLTRAGLTDSRCLEAHTEIVGDRQVQGWGSFAGGWGGQNPYKVFFVAEMSEPFSKYGIWQGSVIDPNQRSGAIQFNDDFPVRERRMGAYLGYKLPINQSVEVKVAISLLSMDQARTHLEVARSLSFDEAYRQANQQWNRQLSAIEVSGGLPQHQQIFYSALRNTFLMPTDVTGKVAGWENDTAHYWDHYCLWDVFRTVMPLHTLIAPQQQRAILNSLLSIYEKKGWLPDAWIAGDYGSIQGGTNVDVVFADAVVKQLGGFDVVKALEAVRKNGEVQSDQPGRYGRFLEDYLRLGYVTSESVKGATSRSLEYAYNDFCIAGIAQQLGQEQLANDYRERSQKVFALFNDSAGFFWSKDRQGLWQPGITPDNLRSEHWNDPYFYEASPLAYSSYVPHDMQQLINRHGSPEAYVAYLDRLFHDGRFQLGNEPLFLLPYQYIYAGRHDKTAWQVQQLMQNEYQSSDDGLPGQDDSGAISSWFVFSSMGFFPVAGQDLYLIGSPLFAHSKIHLENGEHFEVVAHNLSADNIYVQSARLNGKPLNQAWFKHTQIAQGGKLELFMDSKPSNWGQELLPPSLTFAMPKTTN